MGQCSSDLDGAPDHALLAAYAAGDLAAARVLTARLAPRVLGFAARMLKGDRAEAEDVTQEAMLRLWKIAPDWQQDQAKVSTWLFRVASNLCLDRLRRAGRNVDLDDAGEPADGTPGVVERMVAADRAAALEAALATLSERQRQAVVLRHIEGLANPEIAEVMDISVEAVESLTARGKRALAAALSPRREELGYG
ncbi:RNA polymerase sigma factor [Oceaniglobus roseus]|uniref:RNA polymerase sigma factor n=1 Tax=Oceaniglobus roseus TaxID=1737570 RepID=UPI000C7EA37A|nr:RNA polymerase sigma factor [Kandeliimicrobium roseum]